MLYRLRAEPVFPDPEEADPDGLLAVGGDLSTPRLLAAYAAGIFPWFDAKSPILWWSPDPRLVLRPGWLHLSRSLLRSERRGRFTIRVDSAFGQVIRRCARSPRPRQRGTWITPGMAEAYERLHRLGFAHSFEAWEGEELAGGLYGVSLGGCFFGESMFAAAPDASKVAFAFSVRWLAAHGIDLIDCQVHTEHLARFGARQLPRREFLAALAVALERPTLPGPWRAEDPAGGQGT